MPDPGSAARQALLLHVALPGTPTTLDASTTATVKKDDSKKDAPAQRSTIFTTHHEVLEIATSVAPTDLAVPADFKEKK